MKNSNLFKEGKKNKLKSKYHSNIENINASLLSLFKLVHTSIDCKENDLDKIQNLVDKVDWNIVRLAKVTQESEDPKCPTLSNMKDFTWNLLEDLETYCNNEMGISIW